MAAWVLPSGIRMVGPARETACTGGAMFSWSESLSSLGVGSLGCGKSVSLMRTMQISGTCTSTEGMVTSGVALHGGTGSGFIFSSTVVAWLVE